MDVPAGWFEWDQGRGSEGVLVSGGPDAPDGSGWGLLVASVGQLAVNPCNPSKGLLPATDQVDEIVKAMTSWPGFKASAPQPITIDGSAGALVELTYTKDASTCPSSFLWTTPAGTEIDTYPMVDPSASRPAQFRILSVNGKPVIIRTTDFPEPSPFELSQGVAPNPNRHAADQPVLRAMVDSIELSTP